MTDSLKKRLAELEQQVDRVETLAEKLGYKTRLSEATASASADDGDADLAGIAIGTADADEDAESLTGGEDADDVPIGTDDLEGDD